MLKNSLSLSLILLIFGAYAQEEKIIVIDKGSKSRYKEPKEQKLVDNDYVIKFSPLQMIMGEINMGFEKVTNDMSSIEFEFGPTFSEVGFLVTDNHFFDPSGASVDRTTRLGVFGSAAYRFYPMDNARVLNRFYVSPVLKYRLYNFGLKDYSGNLDDQKGNENQVLFSFNFGYQSWLSDHFSMDFFGGLGLAYESHNTYKVLSQYDGNTGLYSYVWDRHSYGGVRFALTAGIKIGIGQ